MFTSWLLAFQLRAVVRIAIDDVTVRELWCKPRDGDERIVGIATELELFAIHQPRTELGDQRKVPPHAQRNRGDCAQPQTAPSDRPQTDRQPDGEQDRQRDESPL